MDVETRLAIYGITTMLLSFLAWVFLVWLIALGKRIDCQADRADRAEQAVRRLEKDVALLKTQAQRRPPC